LLNRFFLWHKRRKKKAWQKRNAAGDISPSAEGDQRSARWIGGRFLEKATEKLSSRFALNRSINQNLKCLLNVQVNIQKR
jgi:hypothetical protein